MSLIVVLLLFWTMFLITTVIAQGERPNCNDHPPNFWVRDPSDCRGFWFCGAAGAEPSHGFCPDGHYFNEREQICDPNIECETNPDDPTAEPPTEPTTENPTEPPTTPPRNVCEGLPNNRFVNDPTGCRSYFVCLNETPHPRQCDMGFNFNEELQICDTPFFTPCSNDDFECPFFGISRWEVPGSCTEYNFCFAGQHQVRECGIRLQFDTSLSLCAPEETVGCTRDLCPPYDDIDNIVYHPSQNDCNQYYMCFRGNPELQFCAAGLYWDQTSRSCQRPEYSDCELDTTDSPTDPTDDVTTDPTETESPVIIECPEEPGLHQLSHPFICQNFFICVNGEQFEQRCYDGLLFDSLLLNCNIAASATCADGATRLKQVSERKSYFLSDIARIH